MLARMSRSSFSFTTIWDSARLVCTLKCSAMDSFGCTPDGINTLFAAAGIGSHRSICRRMMHSSLAESCPEWDIVIIPTSKVDSMMVIQVDMRTDGAVKAMIDFENVRKGRQNLRGQQQLPPTQTLFTAPKASTEAVRLSDRTQDPTFTTPNDCRARLDWATCSPTYNNCKAGYHPMGYFYAGLSCECRCCNANETVCEK